MLRAKGWLEVSKSKFGLRSITWYAHPVYDGKLGLFRSPATFLRPLDGCYLETKNYGTAVKDFLDKWS